MEYNKLVRDRIPEIIKNDGKVAFVRTASDSEYWEKLKEKLKEEIEEFFKKPSEEELADILEVIGAIVDYKNFDSAKIENIKKKKFDERGGFSKRIILEKVK